MDVKTGSGAFMADLKQSIALSESIVKVCQKMKTKSVVVISDMDQPLGRAIGNALEVQESIDCLNGKAPADLQELCIALSAHMIHLGGRARTVVQAAKMAREAVAKGDAAKRFREIIRMQDGCERVMDDSGILPKASHVQAVKSTASGFVTRCDAKSMGLASNALGAGRLRIDDAIDPAVGIYLLKKVGDKVTRGEPLCEIHWNDESRLRDALPLIKDAYEIKSRAAKPRPLIHRVFTG
jgi:thymidine phosphorylase